MENILSYIRLRQDIAFSERTFNAADALILSALAYADLTRVFQAGEDTLPLICLKYLSQSTKNIHPKENSISSFVPLLVQALCNAKRFQDIKLKDFREEKSKEKCLQFAAATFELPDKSLVIAFRGTDGSMTGWHENMKMLYMDDLLCQQRAREYLESMAEQFTESRGWGFFEKSCQPPIYLAGHSKGGNLAMYAALCNPELEKQIVRVYNFDGPGFRESFYNRNFAENILNKIVTVFPKGSIIGRLFLHKEPYVIVDSDSEGMGQHNAFHWQTLPDGFFTLEAFNAASDDMQVYLKDTFLSKPDTEIEAHVDCLFSLLEQLGVETVSDLENLNIQQGIEGFMAMNSLSDEEKDFIWAVIQLLSGRTIYRKKGRKTFAVKKNQY